MQEELDRLHAKIDQEDFQYQVSQEVVVLRLLMDAIGELVELLSFLTAASGSTVDKMMALRGNAQFACVHFADAQAYEAALILMWIGVLRRALDGAVCETYRSAEQDIKAGKVEQVDGIDVFSYSSKIWRAASFACREGRLDNRFRKCPHFVPGERPCQSL